MHRSCWGGVACQPFSRLGDRKEQHDSRSESFPAFLRMLFWLQIPIGIMECTSEVYESSWAQGILGAYMDATGSVCAQKILHLHRIWPAYRTRWWAVITQKGIPAMCLEDLPELPFTPGIIHLIPKMLEMSPEELTQIELDPYELRAFHSCKKGVQSCIVEKCRPMATATHSWGSQVKGCSCGCRQSGFSFERLDSQGLHGAVWVLPGYIKINGEEVSKLRHLHPQEVALMCGLLPSWVVPNTNIPLRLDLAGVGQLASPLQSSWVFTQVMSHLQSCGWFPSQEEFSPKKKLMALVHELFGERNEKWNIQTPTRYMDIFHQAIQQTLLIPNDEGEDAQFQQALLVSVQRAEQGLVESNGEEKKNEHGEETSPGEDDDILGAFLRSNCEVVAHNDPYECSESESAGVEFEVPTPGEQSVVIVASFAEGGGHPGFRNHSSKREFGVQHTQSGKRLKTAETIHTRVDDIASPILEEETKMGSVTSSPGSDGWTCQFDRCYQSGFGDGDDIGAPTVKCLDETSEIPQETLGRSQEEHESTSGYKHVQIIKDDMSYPQIIKIPATCTIQQVIDAETKLSQTDDSIVVRDSVGQVIPPAEGLKPLQRIHVESAGEFVGAEMPCLLFPQDRYTILTKQGAWVAEDEMNYYLDTLKQHHEFTRVQCALNISTDEEGIQSWMVQLLDAAQKNGISGSAVLHDHHWFPVAIKNTPQGNQIYTSAAGSDWVSQVFAQSSEIELHVSHTESTFPNDCGFQTLGWMMHFLVEGFKGDQTDDEVSWALSKSQAEVFRGMFEHHLHVSGLSKSVIQPHNIHFGGVTGGTPEEQLRQMLEDHGVPKDKLHSRVGMILEKIGRQGIIQCCRSPRPWPELKALANSQSPKLQLILPSELAEKIRERVESGASFGDQKKKKQDQKREQTFPKLQPEDLSIPSTVFKQGRDQPVQQVGLGNIGVDASGVVLVTAEQAQPYLQLAKPLSKHGLALLVVDHDNSICSGLGEVLRFPARFNQTNEPIIATARLIQLGQLEVSRHLPNTQLKVEEVQTCVIRALVFKDEIVDHDWSQVVQHPVKYIIQNCNILAKEGLDSCIVDVWDRQFVSFKYDRKKPSEADVFIVTFRLSGIQSSEVLPHSGGGWGLF